MLLTLLKTLATGILATALMSIVMWAIGKSGLARADMVRALGSLLTKKLEGSFVPGLVAHMLSGVMFAFPYVIILNAVPADSVLALLAVGALLGLFHGFVVSFFLVAFVAESHPLEEFRQAGLSVAVSHVAGHIAYGAGVGLWVGVMAVQWGLYRLPG